jgi:hypothetical protein
MKRFKKYLFLLVPAMLFMGAFVKAQSINGDTIFVDAKAEIAIRFPSMPSSFYTIPADAPYNFKTMGTGFTIIAKSKNTKAAPLVVIEGKRTHHFLLVYKKDINYNDPNEIDLDYSSIKKLKAHIKQEKDLEKDYNKVIKDADKAFKKEDYVNAKALYTKALGLLNRSWPAEQIKKINTLIANQDPGKKGKKNK